MRLCEDSLSSGKANMDEVSAGVSVAANARPAVPVLNHAQRVAGGRMSVSSMKTSSAFLFLSATFATSSR